MKTGKEGSAPNVKDDNSIEYVFQRTLKPEVAYDSDGIDSEIESDCELLEDQQQDTKSKEVILVAYKTQLYKQQQQEKQQSCCSCIIS